MHNNDIQPLIDIMTKLRDPQTGCSWDKAQSFDTIVPFTLEEAYEVADTIERAAIDELPDELGDLLFQVVFYCQLGREKGMFDFGDVVDRICHKLTARHPHVFGSLKEMSAEQVKENWEKIKTKERADKNQHSVLDNIPLGLPALSRAVKIQQRVARVGFDWAELGPVIDKIHEEISEVIHEVEQQEVSEEKVQDEVGDLFFAVVNLARHLGVEPEQALRRANSKFERRFRGVELFANQSDKSMDEHTLDELEQYWNEVKLHE